MISSQVLKKFRLFAGLDDSKLAKLAELCHERTLEDGQLCFSQGNKSTDLHLCRNGNVEIVVRINEPWGMEVTVHTAKTGEIFGWSALVEPYVYTASAKCVGKVDEICINGVDLLKLFESDTLIGYLVMKNLNALVSSRLTESRSKLTKEIAASINKDW